jgi:hypothetical protein
MYTQWKRVEEMLNISQGVAPIPQETMLGDVRHLLIFAKGENKNVCSKQLQEYYNYITTDHLAFLLSSNNLIAFL